MIKQLTGVKYWHFGAQIERFQKTCSPPGSLHAPSPLDLYLSTYKGGGGWSFKPEHRQDDGQHYFTVGLRF